MNIKNSEYYFLRGGGEMGERIREKDWSKTPLGDPSGWPQSLRTIVAVMLDNPFGMYIAWGKEYIQIYNDGYRPILGATKHPQALGISTRETFSEIWDNIIGSMFDGVMEGKAVGFPDFMLPLNRNGFVEECYFDFSYSPIRKDNGEVGGVLVTVIETTNKKKAEEGLKESNQRFRSTMKQAPVGITILRGPEYIVEMANDAYLQLVDRKEAEFVGNPLFTSLPEVEEAVHSLLDGVLNTGVPYHGNEVPIPVNRYGKMGLFYFDFLYAPLREEDGNISGIIVTVTEVTEKVEARKKIETSEERLNIVVEASELGTWELNLNTKEPTYSKRYLEILGGYKQDIKLNHVQLLQHLHPDDISTREKAFKEALETGYLHYQSRLIWNDKSIHWMEGRGKVFYDDENKPFKLIGTIRDITEEKKREQELRESESKFRLLADSMPQHIWTSDTEGNLNYFNQSVFDYSGLTLEQLNKDGWIQIVHPDDREKTIKEWMNSITTGQDFLVEHRFRRNDGEYRWQMSRAIPQEDANGNIQMWVGTSTDIQHQKDFTEELENQVKERTKELIHINESLKKSEERYHLMVEEVQDYAILYLNRDGIVENWNEGAEKIKGYKANEIIGKSFFNFYREEDRKSNLPQKLLALAIETGRAVQEGWRVRKDGSLFWASVVITAVHNEEREVVGFSKVTHDLTDKKEAEDKVKKNAALLEEKNIELEKINKELQSFAYISSHDLQEPLRKIQTFATRILEKEGNNFSANGIDMFKRMQDAAKRMQTLIQDLLAYSRTTINERKFETTDLNKIIAEVKEDLKEELKEKHATIEAHRLCDAAIIPFQFKQLMYNLISNSLKFSKAHTPPHIKITSEIVKGIMLNNKRLLPEDKYCHISVSDNGIGFEQQYSDKIFEVFQRLHLKNEYSGTGIGLSIVKKIVDNHNGFITATGEPNKGATFEIYIPAT